MDKVHKDLRRIYLGKLVRHQHLETPDRTQSYFLNGRTARSIITISIFRKKYTLYIRMKRSEKAQYHTLENHMIPEYVKDREYIKLLIIEVYAILNEYQSKSPIAIGDFALWLHGFNDELVYRYIYEKNKFQLPSIDIFATITECNVERLKLIEPI